MRSKTEMSDSSAATRWVDTHCHLFLGKVDPGTALDEADAAGVDWVVCPGIDLETSLAARRIAAAAPGRVRWSAGLHPHEATRWEDEGGRIAALVGDADAVGECGLDYYRDLSPREEQRVVFAEHVELAHALGKPIIVHTRDAFADVHEILTASGIPGAQVVLHCWTGGPRWTRRFLELGAFFSFAGPITYANGDTIRLGAALVPPERALVETDSPFLAPEPHRGRDNRPALVPLTGAALAEVWGTNAGDVAAVTTANAERVFGGPG